MIDYRRVWQTARDLADIELDQKYPTEAVLAEPDRDRRSSLAHLEEEATRHRLFLDLLLVQVRGALAAAISDTTYIIYAAHLFESFIIAWGESQNESGWWEEQTIAQIQTFLDGLGSGALEKRFTAEGWSAGFSTLDQLWSIEPEKSILCLSEVLTILAIRQIPGHGFWRTPFEIQDYYGYVQIDAADKEDPSVEPVMICLRRTDSILEKLILLDGPGSVVRLIVRSPPVDIETKEDLEKYRRFFPQARGFILHGNGAVCRSLTVYFDKGECDSACIDQLQWANYLLENAYAYVTAKPSHPTLRVADDWLQYGQILNLESLKWVGTPFVPASYDEEEFGGISWDEMGGMIRRFVSQARPSIIRFMRSLSIEFDDESLIV